jgi:hypothetical protein
MEYRFEQFSAFHTWHYAANCSGEAKVDPTCWDEEVDDATHGAEVGVVAVLEAETVVADVEMHEEAMGAHRWADNPAS